MGISAVRLSSFLTCPSHLAMDTLQCSPALNALQGITANPDISGIGVRTAIYIQAILSLVHPFVAGYDGKIDDFEMKSLATVYFGILLSGCALLLSAIIQAKTFGLSAYHAMIVLFLSWINSLSALTFFAYILGDQIYTPGFQRLESERRSNRQHEVSELDREWVEAVDVGKWRVLEKVEKKLDRLKSDKNGTQSTSLNREMWELEIQQWTLWRKKKIMTMILPNQRDNLEFQRRWEEDWENNKGRQEAIVPKFTIQWTRVFSQKSILLTGALASAHLTLLSGFGWWFWSTLPNFGIDQECITSIRFMFFTKSIPITSAALRSRSKSIYIFSSLPVINVFIWIEIFFIGTTMVILTSFPFVLVAGWIRRARRKRAHKVPSSATASQPVSAEEANSPPETTSPSNAASRLPRQAAPIFFAYCIITTFTVQTFFIALTELTIAHNRHLIQSKENDWTFAQTLALTLTLLPLIEVVKFVSEKRPWAPEESGESRKTGWAVETQETKEARESGESGGKGEAGDLV
jgi:hypothetical protein